MATLASGSEVDAGTLVAAWRGRATVRVDRGAIETRYAGADVCARVSIELSINTNLMSRDFSTE